MNANYIHLRENVDSFVEEGVKCKTSYKLQLINPFKETDFE